LQIPTDNDTSNKGEIIDENTVINEKDVTFGQITMGSFLYSSKMVRVSLQLLQDSSFPLGPFLGRKLGMRIGRIHADHFTTGNGTTQPQGIVTAAGNSSVQLAAQTPTYAEMVSIQHSIDPAYRSSPGVGWMFHDSLLAEVKKITDASTGRPIWMPNMVGGEPDTILGDPYFINQSMAVAAGSGAGKSILYGDLSKYLIRDVRDVTIQVVDQLYAAYHQVAFFAFARTDAKLLDAGTDPVKYALNKA
jgi:HK97 family phage major capsid protein